MALNWDELKDTRDTDPPLCVFYGGAKLGKTTLASEFPNGLYVRTSDGERQSAGKPMKSFGVSESFSDVIDQMNWMLEVEHELNTLVVDALDGLEKHVRAEACARNGWGSISEGAYGAGAIAEREVWQEFINKAMALKKAGFYVVLIGHVKIKNVPGVTTEGYPQYMINLGDWACSAIADGADLVGFLHQQVSIAKEDVGFKKVNKRGQGGGDINIAVQGRPGFIAGNRYSITKPTLPFKVGEGFKMLSQYFPGGTPAVASNNNEENEEQEVA